MSAHEVLKFYRFICKNIGPSSKNPMFRQYIEKNRDTQIEPEKLKEMFNNYVILFSATSENKVSRA